MTDQQQTSPETPRDPAPPSAPAAPSTEPAAHQPEQRPAIGDTVGTGTSIALGCVVGTVVIVIVGLLFLVLIMLFG